MAGYHYKSPHKTMAKNASTGDKFPHPVHLIQKHLNVYVFVVAQRQLDRRRIIVVKNPM
jgi:hypothetical protein